MRALRTLAREAAGALRAIVIAVGAGVALNLLVTAPLLTAAPPFHAVAELGLIPVCVLSGAGFGVLAGVLFTLDRRNSR